ncbi:MAG: hypothetical protein ACKV2U_30015 [Bryobacteraceae bacterium]
MLPIRKSRIAAPAGLFLIVLVFYWKLTFTDEFVWFDHPDMCYIEIPRLQFQAREFHLGHFPLWDPSIWAGQSLIGQTQPGPLFPLNLIFLLLPLEGGYIQAGFLNWYWVLLHALAALACYALCRDWGRGHGASALAAIGFGCGGFLGTVAWLDVAAGAIFTPLILLYLSRSAEGRRPWSGAALSGMFLGLAWLSGHHEIPMLVTLLFLTVWTGFVCYKRSRFPLAVLSVSIAAMVASMQVLPTIEFGRLSKRWVGVTDPVGWDDRIPYTIATIYSMPARGLLHTFLPSSDRYADCAPFLGLAIVAMALFGIACAGNQARIRWISLATGIALLFALGAATPLHGTLYSLLPGLGKARVPVRAIHIFNLGLCVLAAYGLDAVLTRQYALATRVLSRGLLALGIGITGWAIGNPGLDDGLLLSGLLAFVLASSLMTRLSAAALPAVWITVALIEMHGVSTATYSSRYREDQNRFIKRLEENKDVAEFLRAAEREAPIRVDVNDKDVPLNFGDYHGVDVLGGYVAGVPDNLARAELHTERSKALFAVTHYLGKEASNASQVFLFEGRSGVKVFRNPEVMPRAWSVHEAIRVNGKGELRDQIQVKPIDFHRQTVLQGEVPTLETCTGDEVSILSRSPNRVRIRANMQCTGLVIMADSFYPGWQATVDGKPAKVWEAYGAIRGVVAPAGAHQIELRFHPRSVYVGGVCFLLGLLLTAGLTALRR